MDSKINIKNILILLLFYSLGYVSNIVVLNWADIDIYGYISKIQNESVVQEIPVQEDIAIPECDPCICEEEEIDTCPILIDISGAVQSPGVYCFDKQSTVVDAVKKAKGFTQDAAFKYISMKINLASVMVDNSKIYIPFNMDSNCKLLTFDLPKDIVDITIPDVEKEEDITDIPSECISINTATLEELDTLNGVGPSIAQKIIDGRPYTKLDDLLNVSGIGESTLEKFIDVICL